MKVEVKKVDSVKREIHFEVPKDRVSQKLDEVYGELQKYAKVKGFRPGKVPRNILESQHRKLAEEETLKKIIPEVYHEAIHEHNLSPLDLPEILDVLFKDGTVKFKAVLDIKPEVMVKDYKGIKILRKSSQVSDEDVNKTLEYIKQGQGKDKETPLDDGFAHALGYPNFEEFKKFLIRQMEFDKDRQNRMDVENQIVEAVLKLSKLTTPDSLVKKQFERRLADTMNRLRQQGMQEDDLKKKEEEIKKDLQEAVEKDVRVYLIFDKIAQIETIEVKEGESLPAKVMEFLLKEAKWEEAK
jgi:FKBP-type peptidyl-prolyl cis-trans isomerase (trigger factor)